MLRMVPLPRYAGEECAPTSRLALEKEGRACLRSSFKPGRHRQRSLLRIRLRRVLRLGYLLVRLIVGRRRLIGASERRKRRDCREAAADQKADERRSHDPNLLNVPAEPG